MECKVEERRELTSSDPLCGGWRVFEEHTPCARFFIHYPMEITIVLKGRFTRFYEHSRHDLHQGQIAFCGPWERHGGAALKGTQVVTIIFLPVCLSVSGLPFNAMGSPFFRPEVRSAIQPKTLAEKTRVLNRAYMIRDALEEKTAFGRRMALIDVQRLLLELTRPLTLKQSPPGAITHFAAYDKVFRLFDFVKTNLHQHLSLGVVAAQMGLSRTKFALMFKAVTGQTFRAYLRQIRIENARERILATQDKLSEVARQYGFADASHMTRLFKRYFRLTPSQLPRGSQSNLSSHTKSC